MSDERGDQTVDSTSTTNDSWERNDISQDDYPLTFRSLVFWGFVIGLGLLGTCVVVSILLALMRGS